MLGTNKQSISSAVGVKGSCFGRGTESRDSALRANCKTSATQHYPTCPQTWKWLTVSFHVGPFPGGWLMKAFPKRFGGQVKKSLKRSLSILFRVQMLPLWEMGPSSSSWLYLCQHTFDIRYFFSPHEHQNTTFNNSTFNSGGAQGPPCEKDVPCFSFYR